jgi:hypothetical protein
VIAITSKYFKIISLVFVFIPPPVKIELGKIIPAIPPSFKSCFVLSINKASISLL